jgi:hypothetical protein
MATLLELEHGNAGPLVKLDAGLESHEQEWRRISISLRLRQWIERVLPTLAPQWEVELSPLEQFDDIAWAFVSGEPLVYLNQFKPLRHISGGIWELKTPDLRIFGWFNIKDSFIGVVANQTSEIKQHDLYHGHCGEVSRFRDQIGLDEPKFVVGEDPYAVVSDFHFPK